MRVIGIDPGLRNLGWGVIDVTGARLVHVANGICHSVPGDLAGVEMRGLIVASPGNPTGTMLGRAELAALISHCAAHDIVEETRLARAPSGVETAVNQLRRLVDAHEFILVEARPLSREAAASGDDGTNDLIVSQVVRGNELQSWFIRRHLSAHTHGA